MSEPNVVSAFRSRRLEIVAPVHDTEKKLAKLRASLTNLNTAMNLLTLGQPDKIPPHCGYRRSKYFAGNELPGLTWADLHKAPGANTAGAIVLDAIRDEGRSAPTGRD
jgi:hypothetical protein